MPQIKRISRSWPIAVASALFGALFFVGVPPYANAQSITPDEIAKLSPEICDEARSSFFRLMISVWPFLAGSASTSLTFEQIALIDQKKSTARHKVWILRSPAAFTTLRTCDFGAKNWVHNGTDIQISQNYEFAFVLIDDRTVPITLATKSERENGIRVRINLHNRLRSPDLRRRSLARTYGVGDPPRCREEQADLPGLITFRRRDPNVKFFSDCEGDGGLKLAKKLDEGEYEFFISCIVNCRVYKNYHGWDVEYSYPRTSVNRWEWLHGQLDRFLDEHTVYRDEENG
ncbi:MAG: hypothetical protein HY242_09570 [Afipia sp.]|nr:hypothetical protein [Afipia sp.]